MTSSLHWLGSCCNERSNSPRVSALTPTKTLGSKIIDVVNENGLVFDPKESEDLFFYHGSSQRVRDMTKRENKNSEFVFDRVFGETATNHQVYEYSTREILKALFDGYNCSVFAYGATGSGKTFTMLGDKENPGIAYLTMVELYNRVHLLSEEYEFDIRVSYLEVYNENVRDLLQPDSKHLHLREDSTSGITIANLTICKITSADELFARLTEGNMNRSQHPTDANAESSRSHAVFQTYIHSRLKKTKQQKLVKLSMIDLAGSEKASATGGRGARFAEGQNINRSLLALGNCINCLAAGTKHVPYRDSKLTRLLKDSLGGNCRTVMIANISPCSNTYEDTHRTLKYAERAKMIKLKIVKNVLASGFSRMQYDKLVETLQSENMALKAEVSQLKDQLKMFEAGPSSAVDSTGDVKVAETGSVKKEETQDMQAAESIADLQAAESQIHVCNVVCTLPPTSHLGMDCLPLESVSVSKCDVEVQVSFPAREERGENKLVSNITAVFAANKEMNKKMSCEERSLKRLQWKCYRRMLTTRRLNSLGSDHKELERKEVRMRSIVRAALCQAQEHHNSIRRIWQQLEAHRDKEVAVLAEAQASENPVLDTLMAKCRLEVTVQNLGVQAEHMKELFKVMYTQSEKDDAIIRTLCGCLKSHHTLLKAYGKVTDTISQEYKDCLKALEADKMVKFVGVKQECEEDGDSMAAVSALLWDKERLWSCCDGALPSPHFDVWITQMTTLLEEVESNSVRRESIAYGCTPAKLNATFCKESHDNMDSTFVLDTATSDSAQKTMLPPEPRPVQQQLPTRPTTFGFAPAVSIKIEPGG
ncbi:hypothetical protein PR048_033505 [Dryococelus australis]|uniref:Kinesin motor domain-containing protein n=1 Tax=Dryococelus australis TaxID=614101 RepID=A0ABQ9G4M3_9NEOP|nr:hypothetical protein PR048_033505 [Dryococelus australis]